jgi:hypothetical protein
VTSPATADCAITIALMCLSFAMAATIGFALLDARAIMQLDVWFQSDPDDFLIHRFRDLVRHPNVGLFFGISLSAVRRALRVAGIGVAEALPMQQWLMMLVAPAASAVRTLAAYRALGHLIGSRPLAILLTLLDVAAFATVALASVPESFGPTAASLTALYWLLISDASGERVRWWPWIAVGAFAAGVTLSNLAPFAILLGAMLLARKVRPSRIVLVTGAAVLAVLALTAALAVGTSLITGQPLEERIDTSTGRFIHTATTSSGTTELVLAMSHTFLAPLARPAPGNEPPSVNPDYDFQLLLPTTVPVGTGWWREAFTALVLGLGVAGYLHNRQRTIWLLPAAGVLASNFALHLFYGHHYFLYSLHWAFSMVWIIAGVAFLPGRVRTAAVAGVALFFLVTAASSVALMQQLLAYLRAV